MNRLAYMSTLADRLREAMREAGMSQTDLAGRCGVKQPSVAGWLNEKAKFIRGANLLAAAKALGVSHDWLATGKGPKKLGVSSTAEWPFPFPPEDWDDLGDDVRGILIAGAVDAVRRSKESASRGRRPPPSKSGNGHG
jgi:transcriptional regulator with XRE-family HTH domain